ncbi:beta-lactamase hydrolase domain-containing protein, partial [Brevundimonas sp.]|uniref:beta-lactamase hydrolase domain-containing protein n=1 Tax=Brevundimonas sp. TaxID=1871086 RepID=UPI0035BE26F5
MPLNPASFRPLSPTVSVAGQVLPDQLAGLRDAGFTCLVNHRPDGEEPGHPPRRRRGPAPPRAAG